MAETQNQAAGAAAGVAEQEQPSLLKGKSRLGSADFWGPLTDEKQKAIENAVDALARTALENVASISGDVARTIESMIAEIDKKLTAQVNKIIHNPEFQKLESAWRGLEHLVTKTETDSQLKIKVFNISKDELAGMFKKYKDMKWDQSPLFKKVYEEGFGTPNADVFGGLVGDYHFDHGPRDVGILSGLAKIAASAHAPFISGAGPGLMGMQSWTEVNQPPDLGKLFDTDEYAPWRSLRDSEDSRYVGLAMPRFLARLPWGAKTEPVKEFAFEEETDGSDHSKYCWANSAYAMAANITRAFKYDGWCVRIRGHESGGAVEGLPCHTFPTEDGVAMKCPTEVQIPDRREKELADLGLMPLIHWAKTDYSVFIGAQSLQKPAKYEGPDGAYASSNAQLSARLPYMFAMARFAHFLKAIVRDKIGSFAERADMEKFLNTWIKNYVEPNPATASDDQKARKPLAEAKVVVEEVEGNPGYYTSKFYLRPHYQLEGLDVSLRLVSRLPTGK